MTLLQLASKDKPCHLPALRKQMENRHECKGICSFSISTDCFISTPRSTNLGRASHHFPGGWCVPCGGDTPWKDRLGSSARSYLSWEITCVFQRVFIRLMKVFRRLSCCCLIWFMTDLSRVRSLFFTTESMRQDGEGSLGLCLFLVFNGMHPIFLNTSLSQTKQ